MPDSTDTAHNPIELVVYDEHDDGSFTESGSFDLMEAMDAASRDEERKKNAR